VHRIPASGDRPAHDHLDLRYLAVAPPGGEPEACRVETRGARWFTWADLDALPVDAPMQRALRKIRALCPNAAP